MEQEPKQKAGPMPLILAYGLALGLLLALCMTAEMHWTAEPAATAMLELPSLTAAAPAQSGGEAEQVIPMGRAVGIKLFSDGVLVVGLSPVETPEGERYPGRDCGLKAGDLITHINGSEVDTIEEVQSLVTQQDGEALTIQAVRGQRQLQLTAAPAENEKGVYQLGVWLRDSMAGIGTLTFYNPETGAFAALGHGINDVDTATLMPLESGSIMEASVASVKKGISGQPGELHGEFDLTRDLGTLYANTNLGIFGQMTEDSLPAGQKAVPVASRDQIQEGDATILTNVRGEEVEEFHVKITHIAQDGGGDGTRSLMVQVTDPELLELTGGIVQGMSGSPILQDGRLVGAVTHVLVNDPSRGYGIFAENMLRQSSGALKQQAS